MVMVSNVPTRIMRRNMKEHKCAVVVVVEVMVVVVVVVCGGGCNGRNEIRGNINYRKTPGRIPNQWCFKRVD